MYKTFFNNVGIIDLGSGKIKAGTSNNEEPMVYDSLIGRPKYQKVFSVNSQEPTVFSPSESLRGLYRLERPIKRGVIQNFTDSKIIFDKLFNDMKITNNKETPIFICQPPFTPKKQKNELCQLLLENYDFPSVFFGTQAVLSLYAFGKQNGLMLESGEGVTQVVPIYNGYKLDHAVERINLGGEDVTNYLKILLRKNGVHIHSQFDSLIFQDIKGIVWIILQENLCELNINYDNESAGLDMGKNQSMPCEYIMPDGSELIINEERFKAPEILFEPSKAGLEHLGIHELIVSSIKKLEIEFRKNLYESIHLAGGNTNVSGFANKLQSNLKQILPKDTKAKIIMTSNQEQELLAWQGASAVSSLDTFNQLWITKQDYAEHGDRIFLKKQF